MHPIYTTAHGPKGDLQVLTPLVSPTLELTLKTFLFYPLWIWNENTLPIHGAHKFYTL